MSVPANLYRVASSLFAVPMFLAADFRRGRLSHEVLEARVGRALRTQSELWFHAASVGESASALAAAWAVETTLTASSTPLRSVLFTSSNPTGAQWITARSSSVICNASVTTSLCPADAPWTMRRMIQTSKPSVAVFMQSEIWPSAIDEASRSGAHLVMLDARISSSSFRRWKTFAPSFAAHLLSKFEIILSSTKSSTERLRSLGALP